MFCPLNSSIESFLQTIIFELLQDFYNKLHRGRIANEFCVAKEVRKNCWREFICYKEDSVMPFVSDQLRVFRRPSYSNCCKTFTTNSTEGEPTNYVLPNNGDYGT